MKRYELAKKENANWQVILVQDAETDIRTLTLESVRNGEDWGTTNKKIMRLINETVNALETESLKSTTKTALMTFASRIYLQWLNIYGNQEQSATALLLLAKKGIKAPVEIRAKLNELPKEFRFDFNRAVPNDMYNLDYEKEIIKRVNNALLTNAKDDYSSRYSLRAHIEREVRAEWQQKQIDDVKAKGVDLVWIDTHANCSERCQAFQGKLYSISGGSGTIDGIKYQSLAVATDRYYTTKAGKTYKNGTLSGFNCRHKIKPYTKGSRPNYIPSEVIDKQRELDLKQREYERTIRKYESLALGWGANKGLAKTKQEKQIATKLYNHYNGLVAKWESDYYSFSKQNNLPVFPSRLKI